jgi:hypothetical protein
MLNSLKLNPNSNNKSNKLTNTLPFPSIMNLPFIFQKPVVSTINNLDPNKYDRVDPLMKIYINDATNKSLQRYIKNDNKDYSIILNPKSVSKEWLITGISIVSFFAGFYFRRILQRNN